MNKLTSGLLGLAVIALVTGCNPKSDDAKATGNPPPVDPKPAPPPVTSYQKQFQKKCKAVSVYEYTTDKGVEKLEVTRSSDISSTISGDSTKPEQTEINASGDVTVSKKMTQVGGAVLGTELQYKVTKNIKLEEHDLGSDTYSSRSEQDIKKEAKEGFNFGHDDAGKPITVKTEKTVLESVYLDSETAYQEYFAKKDGKIIAADPGLYARSSVKTGDTRTTTYHLTEGYVSPDDKNEKVVSYDEICESKNVTPAKSSQEKQQQDSQGAVSNEQQNQDTVSKNNSEENIQGSTLPNETDKESYREAQ
jgi:hypothetical protein